MTRLARLNAIALSVVIAFACEQKADPSNPASASSGRPAAAVLPATDRVLSAEQRRDGSVFSEDDLRSRDVRFRRRMARALSRIGDAASIAALDKLLFDEDAEVVAWAAHGLGHVCEGREAQTVRALAVRAVSFASPRATPKNREPASALDARFAISDAISRCPSAEAEATLRAWLRHPALGESAALSLGKLAGRLGRLDDVTLIALLDAKDPAGEPMPAALFAFNRLASLPIALGPRLLERAELALAEPGLAQSYALRALSRAGPDGVKKLGELARKPSFSAEDRATSVRELARSGASGQSALVSLLASLTGDKALSNEVLLSSEYGVLLAALEGLSPETRARPALETLAALELPATSSPALERRIVALRCKAAALLAGSASLSSRLVACDPKQGTQQKLSILAVLDRGPLTGGRYRRYRTFLDDKSPVVRQKALGLIAGHAEITDAPELLEQALLSADQGSVATAAQVLAAYPNRGTAENGQSSEGGAPSARAHKPRPDLMRALLEAYEKPRPPDAIETRVALIDAAAALQLLSFKPRLENDCRNPNPTLRTHAEQALRTLGDKDRRCREFAPEQAPPPLPKAVLPAEIRLLFRTDAGDYRLVLKTEWAPVAVASIAELARKGFYDGVALHRVVPGFVVQFGDRDGDGYGGAGRGLLKSETTPVPFHERGVGLALSGKDTGSSQLFVALGRYPQLDGEYPLLGTAEPGWERLSEGDVIRRVEVSP